MIPYQDMSYSDWNLYWGDGSILFTKRKNVWKAVRPQGVEIDYDEDGNHGFDDSMLLEDMQSAGIEIQWAEYRGTSFFSALPMAPFQSSDWITYEPRLGYFLLGDRLYLIASRVPRSRHKGLHLRRLRTIPPIDPLAMPTSMIDRIVIDGDIGTHFTQLVDEIARRLNEPFPTSWYPVVKSVLSTNKESAAVLDHSVAMLNEPKRKCAYLLHDGVLAGTLALKDNGSVDYTPRNKSKSKLLSSNVNAWIRSRLTATV